MGSQLQNAAQAAPGFTLELMLSIVVFAAIALLGANYPKYGKPLMLFVILGLSVRVVGELHA